MNRLKIDLVGVQGLGEAERTQQEQGFIFFSLERETKIIN